jgi:AAA15 family ATPase/GTPase
MKAISLKNFKRFKSLQRFEFGGITYVVGKNNAGKSTLAKAILLVVQYLKSGQLALFQLSDTQSKAFKVATFQRALNDESEMDFIVFDFSAGRFVIEITISSLPDASVAYVQQLSIVDNDSKHLFHFDFLAQTFSITKDIESQLEALDISEDIKRLESEARMLRLELNRKKLKKSSREYITQQAEINALIAKKDALLKGLADHKMAASRYFIQTSDEDFGDLSFYNSLRSAIEDTIEILAEQHKSDLNEMEKGKSASKTFADKKALLEDNNSIRSSVKLYEYSVINSIEFQYLASLSHRQSSLFWIDDNSNAFSQSIHTYAQLKIDPGTPAHLFVTTWMQAFEIGSSFEIISRANEAYELLIEDGKRKTHIADKGMGSIHAMHIILRLAAVVHTQSRSKKSITLMIEEPEINLHPALQSKITDLLFECHEKYGIDFIIETHSEYMIRRAQVLVAKNGLEIPPNENPFKIYYLPTEPTAQPYAIKFNTDGSLNQSFGQGFYDEASSSTLELIKLKRLSQN